MVIFDGREYIGPVDIDGNDIPSISGVYLICTGASGGERIIALYLSDDMKGSIMTNPDREMWKRYRNDDGDIYSDNALRCYYIQIDDPSEREMLIRRTVDIRPYDIPCYRMPKDDW